MFAAIALVLALSDTATVQVESLKFDPAAIAKASQVEVKVMEQGKAVTYKGVPLRSLLADRLKGPNTMADLRGLADAVLVVRAPDDYQAAISAAEVAMDETGLKYVLAIERDGKPLDAKQGPVKLIVPGDSQHVRWVRMVSGVDLVRMPKPKAKP
jgi:Oxidoreductase molybdopterin binding domain